ncbi:type II toxin-antitoxin system RelE/ParE family toxin [Sphingomonas sp. MMS24-JH45]
MAKVVWQRPALNDLNRITAYIRAFDPGAADRMADRLIECGDSLAIFPSRGRPAGSGQREMTTVPPYVLRYELIGNDVSILLAYRRWRAALGLNRNRPPPRLPPTPMMAQYLALKAEAGECLLFYRMGDFFELFFDDARIAAQVLDIALTARGEHDGAKVPMCGVPVHAATAYLQRLIKAVSRRHRRADREPGGGAHGTGLEGAGAAIVRVVTAGTLTEETLLDARAANSCVAIGEAAARSPSRRRTSRPGGSR